MKRITLLILGFLVIACSPHLKAQEYKRMMKDPKANFFEIQKEFYKYWEAKEEKEKKSDSKVVEEEMEGEYYQFKRWEWFMKPRVGPSGKMINIAAKTFEEWQNQNTHTKGSGNNIMSPTGNWINAGITNYVNGNSGYNGGIGRINCIAFDPTNANIIYCGTPSGGIWKTTTGGNSWTPLSDGIPQIGVSGIAINPNNTSEIYILTGDGDGNAVSSIGVLKSTNGGTTWNTTGLVFNSTSFVFGYKLLIDPSNSSVLLAITSNGIYRSSNAGVSWTLTKTGNFYDAEFKPGASATMYACNATEFYRSVDNGVNWTLITSGLPGAPGSNRVCIAVSANNNAYVYVLYGGPGGFKGVYRSTNSGLNFTLRSNSPNLLGYTTDGTDAVSQTPYDLTFGIDPANVDIIYVGGIQVWKSINGGSNWTCKTQWSEPSAPFAYNHADQHAFEFNGNTIYTGSDGGIYSSTDGANTFVQKTVGMQHTQIYRIAGTPANSNLYYYGAQDNGCNKFDDATDINTHVRGADGMQCRIDFTNSNIAYIEWQSGGMQKTTNGGSTFTNIAPSTNGEWVTPYIMSPASSTTLYAGFSNIYKSTNGGTSWSNVLTIGTNQIAMAMGTNNTNMIYSASSSTMRKSTDGGTTWSNITAGLPVASASITYIAVSTLDANKVWVTFSGYTVGEKVYESTNAGSTWTNISGTLPNLPCNGIAATPGSTIDALYLGTDIGIYYRDDNLGAWIKYSNGLPNVIVNDFHIDVTANKIAAASYGRGLWTSDLYTAGGGGCPADLVLAPPTTPGGVQTSQASNHIESSKVYNASNGTTLTYRAGVYIDLLPNFKFDATGGGSQFDGLIGACTPAVPANTIALNGTWDGPDNIWKSTLITENHQDQFKLIAPDNSNQMVEWYPNPFNASAKMSFKLVNDTRVTAQINDINGKLIQVLVNDEMYSAGKHDYNFDGENLHNGIYVLSLTIDGNTFFQKIVKL